MSIGKKTAPAHTRPQATQRLNVLRRGRRVGNLTRRMRTRNE